ncbi:MAG: hypothetical protein V3U90_06840 [Dehalococcoidia bacterium]
MKKLFRNSSLLALALAATLSMTSCGQQQPAPVCPPSTVEPAIELIVEPALARIQSVSSQEKKRADLKYLAEEMPKRHSNIYFCTSKEDFERAVSRLDSQIPYLTDNQIIVELMKIVAMTSAQGRDGHTRLSPLQEATGFRIYPLRLYLFSDGLFVTDALEKYQDSVGARVVGVGNTDVDEAYEALDPLISRDNAMTVKGNIAVYFLIPEVLHALGIIDSVDDGEFLFEDVNGERFAMNLAPIQVEDYLSWVGHIPLTGSEPLYLSNIQENFWLKFLEDSNTLYIQYNAVASSTQSIESILGFTHRIDEFVNANEVDRVVVDLRHNHGGDRRNYLPLLHVLSENEVINQRGKLFIIIGRGTFSAAVNFTTDMERNTNTLFVGEPTGGAPNQSGVLKFLILPNSNLVVNIGSWYWQESGANDDRLWIAPDIPVELSSEDYFANRDPVMKAILDYKE